MEDPDHDGGLELMVMHDSCWVSGTREQPLMTDSIGGVEFRRPRLMANSAADVCI